jgi:hypothetical protein
LDLPTHFFFGIAVALVFFGRPEVALLVGVGALLPDLDREYWYVKPKKYADEQYHRARFHNVFVILLAYLVSPFLSLGVFLHMLQDSFTTAKDRGVEWFYPLTRLVKRGMVGADGSAQPQDPKEHVYFYQEDPIGIIEHADVDLREDHPVPWRRVYGFAQNSHLLDRGFLFCSLVVILIWFVAPMTFARFTLVGNFFQTNWLVWLLGYLSVIVLFAAGETQRRDVPAKLPQLKPIQLPLFIGGIILFGLWLIVYGSQIVSNLMIIFATPLPIILGVILVPITAVLVLLWQIRKGKTTVV